MKRETVLSILEKNGITADKIAVTTDRDLKKIPGIGSTSISRLRHEFGLDLRNIDLSLKEKIEIALNPVLLRLSGVGKDKVKEIARMVAAAFEYD